MKFLEVNNDDWYSLPVTINCKQIEYFCIDKIDSTYYLIIYLTCGKRFCIKESLSKDDIIIDYLNLQKLVGNVVNLK